MKHYTLWEIERIPNVDKINKNLNVKRRVILDDAYSRAFVFHWNIKLEACAFRHFIVKFAFAPSALTFYFIMFKGYTIKPLPPPAGSFFCKQAEPASPPPPRPQARILPHVNLSFNTVLEASTYATPINDVITTSYRDV